MALEIVRMEQFLESVNALGTEDLVLIIDAASKRLKATKTTKAAKTIKANPVKSPAPVIAAMPLDAAAAALDAAAAALPVSPVKGEMSSEEYNITISEIESIAKSIGVKKAECDGRIDSAMKETPFLNEMKTKLLDKHPEWEVVISPPRASCDIMVNSIRINLKLTDCKSSDNSVNKPSIYYSITGLTTYPYSSNWNDFLDRLIDAKTKSQIKKQRYKPTEYHYLVKNKLTGDVLLKPIFDIHTYVSNASNDLQINWKNEFTYYEYHTKEVDYLKKVESLLLCIQRSVKEMIERTERYAKADVGLLLT
jgi:hypothetical protein